LAEGGTIFLDEVGELPLETQIALLRVLQEREFQRVGGSEQIRANVRVLAATNRDLQKAIAAGAFRQDLFYRLEVFPIHIPPLRERIEDIPVLVEYFVARFARKAGKNIRSIEKEALELLESYPWPGNIRELENVSERSVIVCETETLTIDPSWLSIGNLHPQGPTGSLGRKSSAEEKELIEKALAEAEGRVSGPSGAAAKLGIPASTGIQDPPAEDQQAPVQKLFARELAAFSQLAKLANSQNLRLFPSAKPCVFSGLKAATALLHQTAASIRSYPAQNPGALGSRRNEFSFVALAREVEMRHEVHSQGTATCIAPFSERSDVHWETTNLLVWNAEGTAEQQELVYEVSWIKELGMWRRFLTSQRKVGSRR
jgi:hypothetical protein